MPPRLSMLSEEDQPQEFGPDGERMVSAPKMDVGAQPGAEQGGAMPPQMGASPDDIELDDELLMDDPLTESEKVGLPEEAAAMEALLADDEEERPAFLDEPDGEILRLFENRLSSAARAKQEQERTWLSAWKQYRLRLEGDAAAWKSKVFLPMVYQHVTTALPPMVAAIFDSGPVWEVLARKRQHEPRAKAVSALLDMYMRHKTPAARRLRDLLWYSTLFGTGFGWVTWRLKAGKVRRQVPVYLPAEDNPAAPGRYLGNRLKVEEGYVVDEPAIEVIDLYDAYPCPFIEPDDSLPWFIRRREAQRRDVEAYDAEGYFGEGDDSRAEEWLDENPEDDMQEGSTFAMVKTRAELFRSIGLTPPQDMAIIGTDDQDREHNTVSWFELWTDEWVVMVSVDGKRLLGKRPNPYWFKKIPLVIHHFERVPGHVWGIGIGEVISGLQKQVNFNYNKANDAIQLALNSPIAVRRSGNGLVEGQTAWQPGAIIPCRDPSSDIVPLKVPDPMNAVFRLEDHLSAHADKTTGFNDVARGMSPEGANTATEFAGLQSQTRIRLSQHVREIRTTLGILVRFLVRLMQQFVTEDTVVRVLGDKGLDYATVSPRDIVLDFDYVPSANAVRSNPAMLRTDIAALLPIAIGNPMVKQDKLLRNAFRAFEFPNADEMIQEPPPPPRDPMAEEVALATGSPVMPSAAENFQQHLMVHERALQEIMARQENGEAVDPLVLQAHREHIDATYALLSEALMAGAAGAFAGPQATPDPALGGGSESRRGATALGRAQGSFGGPNGPGPAAAPGRPGRK